MTGVLVTAAELAGPTTGGLTTGGLTTGGRPVTLLDVRWRLGGPAGRELYAAGHIPGAVFVDLDRDLAAPAGRGGRHPMPAAEAFQAAMRRAGVRDGQPVVGRPRGNWYCGNWYCGNWYCGNWYCGN